MILPPFTSGKFNNYALFTYDKLEKCCTRTKKKKKKMCIFWYNALTLESDYQLTGNLNIIVVSLDSLSEEGSQTTYMCLETEIGFSVDLKVVYNLCLTYTINMKEEPKTEKISRIS